MVTVGMWCRSRDGVIAGVCKGLAERFDLDVLFVRLAWLLAILLAGAGLGLYLLLAISLPREDRLDQAYDSRVFGVAARFARRFALDVGLTRAAFVFLLFATGGTMLLAYIIMYFILPTEAELR